MGTRSPVTLPDLKALSPAPRLALVVSRFNETVTGGLRDGAIAWLGEHGIAVAEGDVFAAPGAFEMPLLAQALAKTGRYEGVVCLGCVVKGDTAHFEFISLGATLGIVQASLATEVPVAFGILTTYTEEQATVRSGDDVHNKGREAAAACVESLALLRQIREG
ncbi:MULTISPECIES: 6,7-dimethyl-8-ribityllumazine synthase [Acetobacter]|jgi:6,7-dimethyl-8-ribityllumazine synthase|uniref:6,7-dimethyl-8-ribityllumazine synthase n=1 Tax=Acetobacter lovaniensis TaxID=104100 RepID=A0A841QCN8_9PROT|nr:6,7-dimethyl-8-ribityllumazine synthase [Acetobacter lovaniensis]MBB6456609.1 6,7-dimethyl-8-ribityllumazine synthase [Acetobacter lovaniensis]MCI1698126.1 6,7-dimethyl-8-ribityllumazine synthase [Acetobacter lovaniensis]MCI1796531.1 6,7-dimethyl-8-ribityllumazine synthase [Acetobacter lovaniensis]MCP1238919.1 6,7-dimethyl-8-ribityllumazine synthase [Acetobacter lovaniensis]NHN80967.1 6,7-dimethyl-8-ribityllumazine synthase [Acetobacter lovaniensis]